MKFVSFKPSNKETGILGDITIYFSTLKLTMICNIVRSQQGQIFVSFPNRKFESNGEIKYFSLVKFDKDIVDTVQKEIIHFYELWLKEQENRAEQSSLPF